MSLTVIEKMFDLPYFKEKPNVFYSFAKVRLWLFLFAGAKANLAVKSAGNLP